MAEVLKITDGTTTVNLLNGSGFELTGWTPLMPNNRDDLYEVLAEKLELKLTGSSQDNLASQIQILKKLLRKARQFHDTTWQTTPVYLQAQGSNETGERYALLMDGQLSNLNSIHSSTVILTNEMPRATLVLWREAGWRDAVPGAYTSAVTLAASDGPASPTRVHIANHTDDHALTHIFVFDATGASFSGNQIASSDFDLFPNPVGVNDILYVGSTTGPFHHVVFNTDGASDQNDAGNWDFWNGGWADMSPTAGDNNSSWPKYPIEAAIVSTIYFWRSAGEIVLNISDVGDWAKTTIGGVNAFWVRFEWTTAGSTFKQASQVVYAQRKNYIEIPATAIDGDLAPHTLLAFAHPNGNTTTPDFRTTSRIVMGARSSPTSRFLPNLVFDTTAMDEYWDTSTINVGDADTTLVADEDAPAAFHAAVTFSADATLIKRAAVEDSTAGTDNPVLLDYVGEYRVFIICQQIGGAVGDTSVQFIFEDGFGISSESDQVSLAAKDAGLEVVDVGIVRIPAIDTVANDDLTTLFQITNSFGVYAARSTGSSTMRIYEIFLLPIDEWSATLNAPIIDSSNLALELYNRQRLEVDSGILRPRIIRTAEDYTRNITDQLPIGNWELHGMPPILEPSTQYRIYFKMMNYNAAVATAPFLAPLGKHLACELRTVDRYATLRGAD